MKRQRGRLISSKRGIARGILPWVALGLTASLVVRRLMRARERSLRGQVALITGASRGLGLCLARKFTAAGCRLVICARDEQELEIARLDLESRGADVSAVRCDVADRDQVDQLVAQALRRFGGIDIVVNNAGIIQVGPLEAMALEDFGRAMAVNYWGPLYLIWAVLPHMRLRRHGQIVNITSIGGKVAVPHLLPYDAAKAALINLSEGLTAELAKHGIQVTTIIPGLMRTGSPMNAFFKGDVEREFGWFSVGDSLKLTSMSAERAAERIVLATRRREREIVLSWQAKTLRLLHDLFPNLVLRANTFVNGLLPDDNRGERHNITRGKDVVPLPATAGLTRNMEAAARE
ncbi:MAG: SDR family NAD(P)-dependent oxidoreductase, partial [Deltaproteobacteria bacterium]|nr:SDR family NAD(P)-dependent oxidoreductase [Deltaproteobacteria bacterium]